MNFRGMFVACIIKLSQKDFPLPVKMFTFAGNYGENRGVYSERLFRQTQ